MYVVLLLDPVIGFPHCWGAGPTLDGAIKEARLSLRDFFRAKTSNRRFHHAGWRYFVEETDDLDNFVSPGCRRILFGGSHQSRPWPYRLPAAI
jgi:hypothetical protein